MESSLSKWIGMAEIRQRAGCFPLGDGQFGAFVHALALASSGEEFASLLDAHLESLDLKLHSLSEIESFDARCSNADLDPAIISLAQQLGEGRSILLDEFYVFPMEEGN
jgi:hypothetical protein